MVSWLGAIIRRLARSQKGPCRTEHQSARIGRNGERLAAKYLKKRGYKVLGRNLRTPEGEADLLVESRADGAIVVVEVKTRTRTDADHPGASSLLASPERAVDHDKQRRLAAILAHLARANAWRDRPLRVDVVAIEHTRANGPVIRHHQGLIRAGQRD